MQNDFFEIDLINNFPVVSFPRYRTIPIEWDKIYHYPVCRQAGT